MLVNKDKDHFNGGTLNPTSFPTLEEILFLGTGPWSWYPVQVGVFQCPAPTGVASVYSGFHV